MDPRVIDLIRTFMTKADIPADKWIEKEQILTELADRVLSSSIHSPSLDYEFLVDAGKDLIISQFGSNRRAVEFDQIAQKMRDSTLFDLIGRADVNQTATRLGQTRLDATPMADVPRPASPSNDSLSVSAEYQAAVKLLLGSIKQQNAVSEESLLRDLCRVLRGIDGEYIIFDMSSRSYQLRPKLSPITKGLLQQILRYASLYKVIEVAVSGRETSKAGLIRAAYCSAVKTELKAFQQDIEQFERELYGLLPSPSNPQPPTLTYLLMRLTRWHSFLSCLESITRAADDKRGAGLLDCLIGYVNPVPGPVSQMTVRIFDAATVPLIDSIDKWVAKGSIADECGEFFVGRAKEEPVSSKSPWDRQFVLLPDRIPEYMKPTGLAEQIFLMGKTQNLLLHHKSEGAGGKSPDDSPPILSPAKPLSPAAVTPTVDGWKGIFREQNQRAHDLLFKECRLTEHLCAIRRFLLFEQGDFSQALMELLSEALGRPAVSLVRHNLVGMVETAVAGASSDDADIVRRVDVRLLEAASAKTTGWDVFCLDYRVDEGSPLAVVLGPESMLEYARFSHFLWNLKRVEYGLTGAWSRMAKSGRRLFHGELAIDQRRMELLLSEMRTLIQQLISAAYQGVAGAWSRLESALSVDTDHQLSIDAVIALHRQYLSDIRASFLPWSLPSLKQKLGAVCASMLRAESAARHLLHYASLAHERQRRERNLPPSIPEDRYQAFLGTQLRQLTELRAAFQSVARTFQAELDEFMAMVRKEAGQVGMAEQFITFIDFSGYHQRRSGYDQRKYSSVIRS